MNELTLQEPSPAQLMAAVIQGGVTKENVEALRELVALQRDMRAEEAKQEFSEALAALQAETGLIQAMTPVNKKDGTLLYKYAKLEHIMAKVQPLLAKHGFSHSFDTVTGDEKTITAIFKLTHRSGHTVQNQYQSRVSKGLMTNEAQDDMGAKSYAKRGALCDGLGIVICSDNDAQGLGDHISAEDAALLRERVEECGADKFKFLKLAGADSFETIPQGKLEILDAALKAKEAKR